MLRRNASMSWGCVIAYIKHLKLIEYVYSTLLRTGL